MKDIKWINIMLDWDKFKWEQFHDVVDYYKELFPKLDWTTVQTEIQIHDKIRNESVFDILGLSICLEHDSNDFNINNCENTINNWHPVIFKYGIGDDLYDKQTGIEIIVKYSKDFREEIEFYLEGSKMGLL